MSLDRQLNLDRKKAGLAEINNKLTSKLAEKQDVALELAPYSEVETKFLTIAEEYLENYPKSKDAADVIYESAYLQYTHHDFAKSYKNFWTLVQRYPSHETAYTSAGLILDILNRRKDYERLVAACKRFLETPALNKATFRTDVADILRHGELKRIQVVEEGGQYKEAADQYIEYTKAYGHQDEALFEKALYNASVDYTKASLFLRAVETQEQFLRRFPKSALRESMYLQVAKTYELFATFEKAAYYYEQFAQIYPTNPQAKTAQRLAGLYYWGAGNTDKAEAVMLSYMKLHPEDRKTEEKDLLDVYETDGAMDKLIAYYMRVRAEKGVAASEYVGASLRIAEIQAKKTGSIPNRLMEEALKTAEVYAKDMMASPKGVETLAKLRFWAASRQEDTFNNIKLELPQKQLEINLQRKMSMMKELERLYTRVAGLGSGEWGLGAIYKTAVVYRRMATEIQQAPVPSELTGEQVDLYRDQISKTFLKPFNDKALGLASQCLDKAQELNLLSSWTPKCYGLAAEIDPERHPMVRTFYLPPVQLSLMLPAPKGKIAPGTIKQYAYPFFSFGLFTPLPETRATASTSPDNSLMFGSASGLETSLGAAPTTITYRNLSNERTQILTSALNSEKPADAKTAMSFSYLNLSRLLAPQRALSQIQAAIQRDPQNQPLHNLLGLTYLQMGNYAAAKVTWLSMVAQGIKNGAVWNNLGVLLEMQGRETAALDYFSEATLMPNPREAFNNLGFVSLKYRNGFEAKKQFEQALAIEKNEVTTQVGHAVALLQNGQLDPAKEKLVELNHKYKTDPYSRISLGYYLIDIEKENELASRILEEYIDQQSLESDNLFRQAIQEAKRQRGSGEELPNMQ
jgi:Tfp pilus assembly protein PilF/TolA-binding protein